MVLKINWKLFHVPQLQKKVLPLLFNIAGPTLSNLVIVEPKSLING